MIAAAGNRDTDKGVTYRMPKPLANRFLHYEVKVDFATWQDWAIKNQIHPDVVGYLTTFKTTFTTSMLAVMNVPFATPEAGLL